MRGGRGGFSLIEALVAIAILAGVATAVLPVISSSSDRQAGATARLRATLAAEMLLNRVGLDLALQPQSLAGILRDGSRWRLDVRAHEEAGLPSEKADKLLRIEVEVAPRRRRSDSVRLVTLRLTDFGL